MGAMRDSLRKAAGKQTSISYRAVADVASTPSGFGGASFQRRISGCMRRSGRGAKKQAQTDEAYLFEALLIQKILARYEWVLILNAFNNGNEFLNDFASMVVASPKLRTGKPVRAVRSFNNRTSHRT